MHSTLCKQGFVVKVKFSVKTADNPSPFWSAPIPVSSHRVSLSNSVSLVCFHIASLPHFLTLAFMLSLLCSSSLYLPLYMSAFYQSLRVHLLHSHLYLSFLVYLLLTVSFVCLSTFFFFLSVYNFSLTNVPVNHMPVILLS